MGKEKLQGKKRVKKDLSINKVWYTFLHAIDQSLDKYRNYSNIFITNQTINRIRSRL